MVCLILVLRRADGTWDGLETNGLCIDGYFALTIEANIMMDNE